MNRNNINNQDCGCDGGNSGVNILNQSGNTPINLNNVPVMSGIQNNMNNINNNQNLNNLIAPSMSINDNTNVEHINKLLEKDDEHSNKNQIRYVLYFLVALSINEGVRYFINHSIRLNKGSSNRFFYYPVIVIAALIAVNIFG